MPGPGAILGTGTISRIQSLSIASDKQASPPATGWLIEYSSPALKNRT
jgi:hypothetical protein